ncbi:MAG TPA: aminoacyl-tRNA hydrolase [Candidatus Peribacteraceae bacterium]|nr:aminoacyl-tRNA hydrolase [Candidatus Peribacteraceae bacterium]
MKPSLLIIGLGNPGKQYVHTRHNAGFQAVDVLSKEFGQTEWKENQKFKAMTQEARMLTIPMLLVKPGTYMNLSGESVRKLVDFYKLDPAEQILVLCDDIDLPLGTTRLRKKGSAGTHNGLKSIVEQIGEAFPRLRIGIGPKAANMDLAAWVLSAMSPEERETLDKTYTEIPGIVRAFVLEQTDHTE